MDNDVPDIVQSRDLIWRTANKDFFNNHQSYDLNQISRINFIIFLIFLMQYIYITHVKINKIVMILNFIPGIWGNINSYDRVHESASKLI